MINYIANVHDEREKKSYFFFKKKIMSTLVLFTCIMAFLVLVGFVLILTFLFLNVEKNKTIIKDSTPEPTTTTTPYTPSI